MQYLGESEGQAKYEQDECDVRTATHPMRNCCTIIPMILDGLFIKLFKQSQTVHLIASLCQFYVLFLEGIWILAFFVMRTAEHLVYFHPLCKSTLISNTAYADIVSGVYHCEVLG